MKQYLELLRHILDEGHKRATGPGQARSPRSAIRCVLTCRKVSHF